MNSLKILHISSKRRDQSYMATREGSQVTLSENSDLHHNSDVIYLYDKTSIRTLLSYDFIFLHEVRSIRLFPYLLVIRARNYFLRHKIHLVYDCHDLHSPYRLFFNTSVSLDGPLGPIPRWIVFAARYSLRFVCESLLFSVSHYHLFVSQSHLDYQRSIFPQISTCSSFIFYSLPPNLYFTPRPERLIPVDIVANKPDSLCYFGALNHRRFPPSEIIFLLTRFPDSCLYIYSSRISFDRWIESIAKDVPPEFLDRISFRSSYNSLDLGSIDIKPNSISVIPAMGPAESSVTMSALPNKLFISLALHLPVYIHYSWATVLSVFADVVHSDRPPSEYSFILSSQCTNNLLRQLTHQNMQTLSSLLSCSDIPSC